MLNTEELLRKAVLQITDGTTGAGTPGGDFGGATGGVGSTQGTAAEAPLSVEQVTAFIELMQAETPMLKSARTVTSQAQKWQESIVDFTARMARPGTEATRLATTDRTRPLTGMVEISTVLLRGEVPVSDEVWEDQVAGDAFRGSLERLIADRFGFDIEELLVNGDTASADSYLALLNGWLKRAQTNGHSVDASSYGKDYQEIFKVLLQNIPDRFLRNIEAGGAFYVPKRLEIQYNDILASRGTPLGDLRLMQGGGLTYQGIKIVGVPNIKISNNTSTILLSHSQNLYAGFHRNMRFETYRDPREGATSFCVTARVDAKIAVPDATAVATAVDVSI